MAIEYKQIVNVNAMALGWKDGLRHCAVKAFARSHSEKC
jgi:hypothetical protein